MEERVDRGVTSTDTNYKVALVAGATAGTCVDILLFPLDTMKTRLQSEAGFIKSGGFRGVYSGLLSAALGSAPTAAVFFVTYETTKTVCSSFRQTQRYQSVGHMTAASVGEFAACLIRVPVEVVKQRTQALGAGSSLASFRKTMRSEGICGFYRGFSTTVLREVPFSIIQFPLWELLKSKWSDSSNQPIKAWQSSVCGALSGGISAAITTPLDVAKTRIMLASKGSTTAQGNLASVMGQIVREKGLLGLFAGVVPRVMWISIGGSIFLGVYEKVKISLSPHLGPVS